MKKNKKGISGEWHEFGKVKVEHTLITKNWTYQHSENNVKTYIQLYLAPYGMVQALTKLHSNRKSFANANVLSKHVKLALDVMENECYDSKNMKLDVGNFGNLGEKEFDYIYCSICTKDILPSLLHTHRGKLPANATIKNLLGRWDILNIQPSYLDMAGCLIPHEGHVHAGANARRFIE